MRFWTGFIFGLLLYQPATKIALFVWPYVLTLLGILLGKIK